MLGPGNPSGSADWTIECSACWTVEIGDRGNVTHKFDLDVSGLSATIPSSQSDIKITFFPGSKPPPPQFKTKIGDFEENNGNHHGWLYSLPLSKVYRHLGKPQGKVQIHLYYPSDIRRRGNMNYLEVNGIQLDLLSPSGIRLLVKLPAIVDWKKKILGYVSKMGKRVHDGETVNAYKIEPLYLIPDMIVGVDGQVRYPTITTLYAQSIPVRFELGFRPIGLTGIFAKIGGAIGLVVSFTQNV